MHANVVSMDLYRRDHSVKHSTDTLLFERLKGCCSASRINTAQRMCAANIRNGTPRDHAIDAAARWASVSRNPEPPSAA